MDVYCDNHFNKELEQLTDGKLDCRHVFNLGKPSVILSKTGFPVTDDIELASGQLARKAKQHGFDIRDMNGLVDSIRNPVAVFAYGDAEKTQNVIIDLMHEDKNFLIGIHFNQEHDNSIVSSIRGIFPKDTAEWLNWINQSKGLYLNIKKIQDIISKRRTNLADVTYLDLDSIITILEENKSVNDYFPHRSKLKQNEKFLRI